MLIECRERGREGEREEEKQCERETAISCISDIPWGPLISSLDMCPDWESNSQPFHLWDDVPTN